MAAEGSTKVVIAAFIGNGLIAVTKFVAAGLTGSSAMFSEAIHSVVDTGNQALMLYGMKRAARPADALDVGLRDSIGTAIHAVNHLPGIGFYWRQRKAYFQPEFVDWAERLLDSEPLTDMDAYQESSGAPAE